MPPREEGVTQDARPESPLDDEGGTDRLKTPTIGRAAQPVP